MTLETSLEAFRRALSPRRGVQGRVYAIVRERVAAPRALAVLRELLSPSFERIVALREHILLQLVPVSLPTFLSWGVKWGVACALVLLFLHSEYLVSMIAPQSDAQSQVFLIPTRGRVSISRNDWWQPVTEELPLHAGALIRTEDGEATIVLHDDGVMRLGPFTTLALHDITDRPDPSIASESATLFAGNLWIQGLVPSPLRGVTVSASTLKVSVQEGSIAIVERDGETLIDVWNRRAMVYRGGENTLLSAGERLRVRNQHSGVRGRIPTVEYAALWSAQNLERDAVHQREIAQWQHERRVALAGILPTSPLYPMKRAKEAVDVLLTFGEEAKIQKKLAQAGTRLNEAAALLADGARDALVPLQEYRQTFLLVASGSGQSQVAQTLLQQEVAESTAAIAAAVPGEEGYLLKKVILEASVAVPGSTVDAEDIEGILLLDTLAVLPSAVESGDVEHVRKTLVELTPTLALLKERSPQLTPDVQKEVTSLLSHVANTLVARADEIGEEGRLLLQEVRAYLPVPPPVRVKTISEEELKSIVAGIYGRVFFVYKLRPSRENQLRQELRALKGHPDRAMVLRRLYQVFPPRFAGYVQEEMQRMKQS